MITAYEVNRLKNGLRDTGPCFENCYAIAKYWFMAGESLDTAIKRARDKYGF